MPDRDWNLQTADRLVIVYGMACPLKCDFCCHPVERYGSHHIADDHVVDLVQQAETIPSIGRLCFTGGEPFLYHKHILAILERAASRLPVRIITAAHWATSRQTARDMLAPLVALGLDELSVSTDPSHQQFVPREHAENAIHAALDLGLVTEVAAVVLDPELQIHDFVTVTDEVFQVLYLAAPIGRGDELELSREKYGNSLSMNRCLPRGVGYDVTVYPDGNVYPCCSGGYNRKANLLYGNTKTDRLAGIVDRIHADPYLRVAMHHGIGTLWEIAEFQFPEIWRQLPDITSDVSVCDACVKLRDPAVVELLQPVVDYADQVLGALRDLETEASVEARHATPTAEVPG